VQRALITLRENDQLGTLAGQINSLLSGLRGRFVTLHREIEHLESALSAEMVDENEGDLPTAQQACEQLRIALRQLHY